MARVVASAPGKLILFGEHFVVKGYRAIATAVSLRARVTVEGIEGNWIELHSPPLGLKAKVTLDLKDPSVEEFKVYVEILRALKASGYSIIPHRAIVDSEMPIASGLGSSAATSVAYVLAYTTLLGAPVSREELLRLSLEGEKVAHGRPSGVDNMIAVMGGTIVYRRGENPRYVDVRIPGDYIFIVADTGIKRSTRSAVEHVLRLAESLWDTVEHIYIAADRIVERALKALTRGDMELLGKLMNLNHGLLSAMGVSNMNLDMLVNIARSRGALGAKLTGAGWGGCVVALARREDAHNIVGDLERYARLAKIVDVNAPGAVVEDIRSK